MANHFSSCAPFFKLVISVLTNIAEEKRQTLCSYITEVCPGERAALPAELMDRFHTVTLESTLPSFFKTAWAAASLAMGIL
jgi:hypothetical protein